MDKKQFEGLMASAVNDAELRSSEIPAIDLYVDQIINLHTEKLKTGDERFFDRQLTKTMINNYAKDRVITPVKGKKYTKEQILQILLVYTLKGTLTIGEIKRYLDGAYAIEGFDATSLTELYDRYSDTKDKNREFASRIVDEMMKNNGLDIEKDEDFLVALASVASISAFMKNIAQAMIDAKYPQAPEEPDKDKNNKDDKKDKPKKEKPEKEEKLKKEKPEKADKPKKEKPKKEDKKSKKNEETVPAIDGMTAWS